MKHITNGTRPLRPAHVPGSLLPDPIWEAIESSWKLDPSLRWDIGKVCQRYSFVLEDTISDPTNGE